MQRYWSLLFLTVLWRLRAEIVFELTLSWERHALAGISRPMFLINGQSPGPVIEVEQDDDVAVLVHNRSPVNTTMHFHGIDMASSPWTDGVPGVTQRPVRPGSSFTYRFRATQYGSYWYHSHSVGQIEDGMYGAVVIRPRRDLDRPFHLIPGNTVAMRRAEAKVRPLLLYDHMRLTSEQKWDITPRAGVEISCYDAILFNGKGRVTCLPEDQLTRHLTPVQKADLALVPGQKLTDKGCLPAVVMAAFGGDVKAYNASAMPEGIFEGCHATQGSTEIIRAPKPSRNPWVAIDIIGALNFVNGVVSIDGHDMWVYAVDGSYIAPQRVHALAISNGERYSVLVRTSRPGKYPIRCHANSAPQTITGSALLRVSGRPSNDTVPSPWINLVGDPVSPNVVFFNHTLARPYPAEPVPQASNATYVLNMTLNGASYLWALNGTGLEPISLDEHDPPVLFHPSSVSKYTNVTISSALGTVVDLVLYASSLRMPPHPIHKHGVKMFHIGTGTGPFRWASVDDAISDVPWRFNLVDPPRRDTVVSLPTGGEESWVVVRYRVSSPGAWLLHCHILNHMMGGMMMVLMDGVDAWPEVPTEYLGVEEA